MSELCIVAHCQFQALAFCETYKLLGFRSVYSEGFFYINMASGLKAQFGDRVMALRWSRNVHDIRCGLIEKILHLREIRPKDRKSTRLNSSHRCISYAVFCLK